MSDHILANDPVRPARRFPRRTDRHGPDRLTGVDMRTRLGKVYSSAFIAALRDFPGADPAKVAEVARLRSIAALAQSAALTGSGSTAAALRATASAERARRDLGGKTP